MTEITKTSTFLKSKPWWTDIHALLEEKLNNIFPNTLVVSMPNSDIVKYEDVNKIFTNPKVILLKMIDNQCHDNVDELLRLGKIDTIAYGYALSENDFRWREHSWGIKNDKIIETTTIRKVYVQLNNIQNIIEYAYIDLHNILEKKLNKLFPNTHFYTDIKNDINKYEDVIKNETYKISINPKVKLLKMNDNQCHNNVNELLQLGKIDKIGYGFSLSENDYKLLEHSWGIKDDEIIETTVVREVYIQLNINDDDEWEDIDENIFNDFDIQIYFLKELNKTYPNTKLKISCNNILKYEDVIKNKSFKIYNNKNVDLWEMYGNCHDNVGRLVLGTDVDNFGYGYALDENSNTWKEHSWGIINNRIIETTSEIKKAYVQLNVSIDLTKYNELIKNTLNKIVPNTEFDSTDEYFINACKEYFEMNIRQGHINIYTNDLSLVNDKIKHVEVNKISESYLQYVIANNINRVGIGYVLDGNTWKQYKWFVDNNKILECESIKKVYVEFFDYNKIAGVFDNPIDKQDEHYEVDMDKLKQVLDDFHKQFPNEFNLKKLNN